MLGGPLGESNYRVFTTAFKRAVSEEYLAGASLNALSPKHEVARNCFQRITCFASNLAIEQSLRSAIFERMPHLGETSRAFAVAAAKPGWPRQAGRQVEANASLERVVSSLMLHV